MGTAVPVCTEEFSLFVRDDKPDIYGHDGCGWFAKLRLSTSQALQSQHVGTKRMILSSDIKVYSMFARRGTLTFC